MSSNKPSLNAEITVNDEIYIYENYALWVTKL